MVDHLVLNCDYASELWSLAFLQWVMPHQILEVLVCKKRRIVRWGVGVVWCAIPLCGVVWCAIPLCLLWMVWRERNRRAFEGLEWHSTGSKLFLMCPLHEWMVVSNHSSSTVLAFIDSYSLSKLCCLVYFLCTKGLIFIWQNYINIIKNYYL